MSASHGATPLMASTGRMKIVDRKGERKQRIARAIDRWLASDSRKEKRSTRRKVIQLPNMAERRRRRLNAEIASAAVEHDQELADTAAAEISDEQREEDFVTRIRDILAKCAPKVETLSNLELISELTHRFESRRDRHTLGNLLKRAARTADAQRRTFALEQRRCLRTVSLIESAEESQPEPPDEIHRKEMLRRGIKEGIRKGGRGLDRIADANLIRGILRFAHPENDLGEIFTIIARAMKRPKAVKARCASKA